MNDLLVAAMAAIPAAVLGVLAYRRSIKVDQVSAQSGMASDHRAGTAQVIEGLNQLIDQYQESVKESREIMAVLEVRIVTVTAERDALRLEVARLRRKYGNGD